MKTKRFVTPDGSLIVQPMKCAQLMGNRGKLGPILNQLPQPHASGKAWITCILKKNGVPLPKVDVTYTKLFFLDEVTAFAAGHRPCGQCQPERYNEFVAAAKKTGLKKGKSVDESLYDDCFDVKGQKKTFPCTLAELPSGVMVLIPESSQPHLLLWNKLFPWTMNGYDRPIEKSMDTMVSVLTPSLIVQIFKDGFPLLVNREETVHPSVLI